MLAIVDGGLEAKFPKMVRLKQNFPSYSLPDFRHVLIYQLKQKKNKNKIKPGMSIALGVGSRGIANIQEIVKITLDYIKEQRAKPFIVPAIGSQGEASIEGQEKVLASIGITKETMGVPIRSSMEVVTLSESYWGKKVYFDKLAFHADGIIPINRVKCHTDFRGPIESGLLKMLVIGFGKQKGAKEMHSLGYGFFHRLIPEIGQKILNKLPVLFGIACVEDAYDQLAELKILAPKEILVQEKKLLRKSKRIMARLNIPKVDVLVIEEIGKDISGTGLDPNIIGRFHQRKGVLKNYLSAPKVKQVVVLDLSEKTLGNACGIGYADITVRRLVDKINYLATYANVCVGHIDCIGDNFYEIKIPIIMDTDKMAISLALKIAKGEKTKEAHLVRIKNTLNLHEIEVSHALYQQIKDDRRYKVIDSFRRLQFNSQEELLR